MGIFLKMDRRWGAGGAQLYKYSKSTVHLAWLTLMVCNYISTKIFKRIRNIASKINLRGNRLLKVAFTTARFLRLVFTISSFHESSQFSQHLIHFRIFPHLWNEDQLNDKLQSFHLSAKVSNVKFGTSLQGP